LSRARWLALGALLSASCSLHSLAYLQKGRGSSDAGAEGGDAGAAGAPVVVEAGAAGAPPLEMHCDDQQTNGDETDVDCGGRLCGPCADTKQCLKGSDCQSAICTNQVCQPPTCTDLARNGDETDVNCGGSCPPCSTGHGCVANADCASQKCLSSVCVIPNCDGTTPDPGCPLLIDNTAYWIHPADVPASCIDDSSFGVDDGVGAQQYMCRKQINQTYWAIAQANGYFSLRSALSGKCLQVRGNSSLPGAAIEQSTCTGQAIQLFLPSATVDGVKLGIQATGLSLDVAGTAVPADRQGLIQSVDDGSLDMRWVIEDAKAGAFLTLAALGQTGVSLWHDGTMVRANTSAAGTNAEWKVVPGLAETGCVSFESRDQPGAYLRHSNFLLWSDISDGSIGFTLDATFCFRAALSGTDGASRSLESFNYPGYYVNADDGRVKLLKFADTASYRQLATWFVGPR